jgi:hypothetical protein
MGRLSSLVRFLICFAWSPATLSLDEILEMIGRLIIFLFRVEERWCDCRPIPHRIIVARGRDETNIASSSTAAEPTEDGTAHDALGSDRFLLDFALLGPDPMVALVVVVIPFALAKDNQSASSSALFYEASYERRPSTTKST